MKASKAGLGLHRLHQQRRRGAASVVGDGTEEAGGEPAGRCSWCRASREAGVGRGRAHRASSSADAERAIEMAGANLERSSRSGRCRYPHQVNAATYSGKRTGGSRTPRFDQ